MLTSRSFSVTLTIENGEKVMARKEETFGEYIRHEREAKGITLRAMARQIGVSATFLSKVETQDWKPGEDKLRKIAETIECDVEELLARAGRVPSELTDIIRQHPHRHEMVALLRTTRGMTAEDMKILVRDAEKAKGK